jgi:hypothetical protein
VRHGDLSVLEYTRDLLSIDPSADEASYFEVEPDSCFIIPDRVNGRLVHRFLHVWRHSIALSNGTYTNWICDCDKNRINFYSTSAKHANAQRWSLAQFKAIAPDHSCIHAQAMEAVYSQHLLQDAGLDNVMDGIDSDEDLDEEIDEADVSCFTWRHKVYASVHSGPQYSRVLLQWNSNTWKCTACSSHGCHHITNNSSQLGNVRSALYLDGDSDDDTDDNDDQQPHSNPSSVSNPDPYSQHRPPTGQWRTISREPSSDQLLHMNARDMRGIQTLLDQKLSPSSSSACHCSGRCSCAALCPHCGINRDISFCEEIEDDEVTVYDSRTAIKIRPRAWMCQCRQHRWLWDGNDEGVFRWSRGVAVTFQLMIELLLSVKHNGMPTNSYFMTQSEWYHIFGNQRNGTAFLAVSTFQKIFWSYLACLDMQTEEAFTCPDCGTLAECEIVICDAKRMGCKRIHAKFEDKKEFVEGPARQGSLASNRMLFADATLRSTLARFCGRQLIRSGGKAKWKDVFIPIEERDATLTILRACDDLKPIIDHIIELDSLVYDEVNGQQVGFRAADPFRKFLRELARPSAIYNGLVHDVDVVLACFHRWFDGDDLLGIEDLEVMRKSFPTLHVLLTSLNTEKLPQLLIAVLRSIATRLNPMFLKICNVDTQCVL